MKEEQGKECMGRELGTIREAKIPTFFVALGKEVAASGLDFVTWKEQNPEESVKAAVKYIAATDRSLSMIPDKQERLSFILASYNAGLGHIYDAMALAEKYGKNKLVWKDNVENFILLKSNEEYFTDPICKNGYFRGIETYNFVRDILSRYESYKKKIKA